LHFDRSRWDGSDIFKDDEGTGWTLVTERVAALFKKHKVSNCELTDIESVELLASESAIIRGA
jgi:hypothetical protein